MTLNGLRVLVVEREILIALEVQRVLEGAGARAVVLARAAEGEIDPMDARSYDLVIVDARFGAPEAVALVRGLVDAGIPVVLTSADGNVASTFRATAFLEKPFTEADLVATCITALGARPAD